MVLRSGDHEDQASGTNTASHEVQYLIPEHILKIVLRYYNHRGVICVTWTVTNKHLIKHGILFQVE
jgi:hypothetical protein